MTNAFYQREGRRPPRPPAPGPLRRSGFGRASLTVRLRPSSENALSSAIALRASSSVSMLTKAKPRDFPVSTSRRKASCIAYRFARLACSTTSEMFSSDEPCAIATTLTFAWATAENARDPGNPTLIPSPTTATMDNYSCSLMSSIDFGAMIRLRSLATPLGLGQSR